jgi:hypothetical protein
MTNYLGFINAVSGLWAFGRDIIYSIVSIAHLLPYGLGGSWTGAGVLAFIVWSAVATFGFSCCESL